ncbi:hypothetical protein [Actinoalloteichus caeruleus]|uniref:hypothetical protein n=1 Tax=Actinoalloteichus cyanogriseus TaxID=2893586 RepID=UPI003BB87904
MLLRSRAQVASSSELAVRRVGVPAPHLVLRGAPRVVWADEGAEVFRVFRSWPLPGAGRPAWRWALGASREVAALGGLRVPVPVAWSVSRGDLCIRSGAGVTGTR